MQKGLTLKYDTLEDWAKFMEPNVYSPTCNIVGKNGKGKLKTLILAAISPFLRDLLSSLPPYIDGCIILPDIDWEEISQFLESLPLAKDFIVPRSLMEALDGFSDNTTKNIEKEDLLRNMESTYFDPFQIRCNKEEIELAHDNKSDSINQVIKRKRPSGESFHFRESIKKMKIGYGESEVPQVSLADLSSIVFQKENITNEVISVEQIKKACIIKENIQEFQRCPTVLDADTLEDVKDGIRNLAIETLISDTKDRNKTEGKNKFNGFFTGKQSQSGPQIPKYIISKEESLFIDELVDKKIWIKGPSIRAIEIACSNNVSGNEVINFVNSIVVDKIKDLIFYVNGEKLDPKAVLKHKTTVLAFRNRVEKYTVEKNSYIFKSMTLWNCLFCTADYDNASGLKKHITRKEKDLQHPVPKIKTKGWEVKWFQNKYNIFNIPTNFGKYKTLSAGPASSSQINR